jgi:hypothetical protein
MPSEPHSGDQIKVSALVTAGMQAHLLELGNGNLSAGLRLQMTTPTTTPSGAVWCSHPEQLPAPEDVTGPSVLACPGGVVTHGVGATSIIFDAEGAELLLLDGDDANAIVRPLTLASLAAISASLTPALLAVIDPTAPGTAQLPLGLHVRLLAPGLIAIGSGRMWVALDLRHAVQLSAEVSSLLARQLTDRQVAIHGLERALQAEPAAVAP